MKIHGPENNVGSDKRLSDDEIKRIMAKARKGFEAACKRDPYLHSIAKKQGLI